MNPKVALNLALQHFKENLDRASFDRLQIAFENFEQYEEQNVERIRQAVLAELNLDES